jgi:hypothetical protein
MSRNGIKPHAIDKAIDEVSSDSSKLVSDNLDRDNAFMLYATFCGDTERTAHAMSVTPEEVRRLAEQGQWDQKLRGILELKKSGKAGDVERAMNRAVNYVQAHRLRLFLERVLQHIFSCPLEQIEEWMFSFQYSKGDTEPVKKFSTRPLADLAAALEKCHVLTYMALGDSATERRGRNDTQDADVSGGEIHARIAAAMSKEAKVVPKVP